MSEDAGTRDDSPTPGRHGTGRHRPGRGRGPKGGRRGGPSRIVRVAADALDVRRAFGRPEQHGDVSLVPVALVVGGSGAGWGGGEMGAASDVAGRGQGSGDGGGGGFGLTVRPLGVYVVSGSDVRWQPALDLGRVILGGQLVGAVAVVAVASVLRRRRRR